MSEPKRESLCIDAMNGPVILMGTTLVGWIVAPLAVVMIISIMGIGDGYREAIVAFIVLWLTPPALAKFHPHLVTALFRDLFFGDVYDAD